MQVTTNRRGFLAAGSAAAAATAALTTGTAGATPVDEAHELGYVISSVIDGDHTVSDLVTFLTTAGYWAYLPDDSAYFFRNDHTLYLVDTANSTFVAATDQPEPGNFALAGQYVRLVGGMPDVRPFGIALFVDNGSGVDLDPNNVLNLSAESVRFFPSAAYSGALSGLSAGHSVQDLATAIDGLQFVAPLALTALGQQLGDQFGADLAERDATLAALDDELDNVLTGNDGLLHYQAVQVVAVGNADIVAGIDPVTGEPDGSPFDPVVTLAGGGTFDASSVLVSDGRAFAFLNSGNGVSSPNFYRFNPYLGWQNLQRQPGTIGVVYANGAPSQQGWVVVMALDPDVDGVVRARRIDPGGADVYTPANPAHWDDLPDSFSSALDDIAARIRALEP